MTDFENEMMVKISKLLDLINTQQDQIGVQQQQISMIYATARDLNNMITTLNEKVAKLEKLNS